ncbi:MAG: alpha/beta fold hydrolase [Acidimicrobiales bacterium]
MKNITLDRADVVLHGSLWEPPTLLLLHAGRENRRVWGPVMASEAMSRYRCLAFDLRGHGESVGEVEAFAAHVGDVRAMIGHCAGSVIIVGASIGGLAAIAASADVETSQKVEGLVLLDVVPDPPPSPTRSWLDRRGLLELDASLIEEILQQGPARLRHVSTLTCPVALIRGTLGSPVTDEDEQRFRSACPQLETFNVEAGHLIAHDAPQALAVVIADIVEAWRLRNAVGKV